MIIMSSQQRVVRLLYNALFVRHRPTLRRIGGNPIANSIDSLPPCHIWLIAFISPNTITPQNVIDQ